MAGIWEKLTTLSFLTWLGWAASIILVFGFIIGLILQFSSKKETSFDRSISVDKRSFWVSVLTLVGLFAVVFISRYFLSKFIFGTWYFADEAFDSCIKPFQFSQGEPLWGGDPHFLVYFIHLAVYKLFGCNPQIARMTSTFFFAIAVAIFYITFQGIFGKKVSFFVVGTMIISSPFITHSIYASFVSFAFFPTALILWTLSRPLTRMSSGLLGPLTILGLFFYPGAFMVGVSLILSHALFFYNNWTPKNRGIALLSFLLSIGLALKIRSLILGYSSWTTWGYGFLTIKWITTGITTVLSDVFWKSSSWNTINVDAPYFEQSLLGFLGIGILLSFFTLPLISALEKKWIWTSLLTFFIAIFLASFAGVNPGVRRVISALPLLLSIAGLGFKFVFHWKNFRTTLYAVLILCFGLVALQSYVIITKRGTLSSHSDFMITAQQELLMLPANQKVSVVFFDYDPVNGLALLYRSALMLDKSLKDHFNTVKVFRRDDLSHIRNLKEEILFLANEIFPEKGLQDIFGRLPNSSKTIQWSELPQPYKLVAIYHFTHDSSIK